MSRKLYGISALIWEIGAVLQALAGNVSIACLFICIGMMNLSLSFNSNNEKKEKKE
jgi:hypothetical protein